MTIMHRVRWLAHGMILSAMFVMILSAMLIARAFAEDKTTSAPSVAAIPNRYWVDAAFFSCMPGEELKSYRGYGSGGAAPNATLGFGASMSNVQCDVEIVCKLKSKRFVATVNVKPGAKDQVTKQQSTEIDLTDLLPKTLEISRAADGRVLRLNLTPKIDVPPTPAQFSARDLKLESWSFPSSPVVLNNQDYLGDLSMSSGALAWCEIPGLAKIEFSLLHIKDAKVMGSLKDGIVTIANDDGTQLQISNVKNGEYQETLPGGPYQVWVRWQKPTYRVEEYRKMIQAQIAKLKESVKNEDLTLPSGAIERLEKSAKSDRPTMISFGVSYVAPSDVVKNDARK